jgi:excisionase family DNA binding protein
MFMGSTLCAYGAMAPRRQAAATEQLELFPPSPYLSVDQVAELLGVPKSFIYRRTCDGHPDAIPAFRFGGHLRFRLDEVEAWIEEHRKDAPPPPPVLSVAARRGRGRSARASNSGKGRKR